MSVIDPFWSLEDSLESDYLCRLEKKMKKIDLSQATTVLANIGVIAGIVFLGVEISQNTRSLQAEAYRELTNAVVDLNRFTIEARSESPTNESPNRFLLNINLLRHGDLAYQHYELGMLSRDRLNSILAPLDQAICRSDLQQQWTNMREFGVFVPSYQKFLDDRISEIAC